MRKQDTGKKLTVSLIVLALTVLAAIITRLTGLETTSAKLIGSFAAVFLLTGVVWRFPFRFYCMAFGFEVLAAVLGSALNLYHYLGFYDKFVHYTSGIVLAEGGLILINALAGRRHTPAEPLLCRLFSMFSSPAPPASPRRSPVPASGRSTSSLPTTCWTSTCRGTTPTPWETSSPAPWGH